MKDFDISSPGGLVRVVGIKFLAEDRIVSCGKTIRFHEIDSADIKHAVDNALWLDANAGLQPDHVYMATANAARLRRVCNKLVPQWLSR